MGAWLGHWAQSHCRLQRAPSAPCSGLLRSTELGGTVSMENVQLVNVALCFTVPFQDGSPSFWKQGS